MVLARKYIVVGDAVALLPCRHTQWIIPGNNLSYYADGLAQGVGEFLVGGADGLAEDFVGPAGVVAEGGDGFGQVFGEGYGVGFAWGGYGVRCVCLWIMGMSIPLSQLSTAARISLFASMRSASLFIRMPLSVPGSSFHDGWINAAFAACTAMSTSFAEAAWTSAITDSVLVMWSVKKFFVEQTDWQFLRRINRSYGLAT